MMKYSDIELWYMYGDLIPECFKKEKKENQE